MIIKEEGKNVLVKEINDFDLAQTLECGQCFRFDKLNDDDYVVVAYGKAARISYTCGELTFHETSINDVRDFWIDYFDLKRDYGAIKEFLLRKDHRLQEAIEKKSGIRLLNQEFNEMLISFIISQNKQIPHIKYIVKSLCNKYGNFLVTIEGEDYYSFPDVGVLAEITEEQWRELKVGFRAPYLMDASKRLSSGEVNLDSFYSKDKLVDEETALELLTSIKGVGEKVANCVMLFALGYRSSFPVDVWIKRIMEHLYFDGKETSKDVISKFAKEQYGEYGGYAQQYLFSYGRDNNLGK